MPREETSSPNVIKQENFQEENRGVFKEGATLYFTSLSFCEQTSHKEMVKQAAAFDTINRGDKRKVENVLSPCVAAHKEMVKQAAAFDTINRGDKRKVENVLSPCVAAFPPPINPLLSCHCFAFPLVTLSQNFLALEYNSLKN